jgi:hypothetical protein
MLHCQLMTIDLVLCHFTIRCLTFHLSWNPHFIWNYLLAKVTTIICSDFWEHDKKSNRLLIVTFFAFRDGYCDQQWRTINETVFSNLEFSFIETANESFFEWIRTQSLHTIIFVVCHSMTLSSDGNAWSQSTMQNCDFKFCHSQELFICFLDSTILCNHHHSECKGSGVSDLEQRKPFFEETAFSIARHSFHCDSSWLVCSAAYDLVALFLSHAIMMATTIECIPFTVLSNE